MGGTLISVRQTQKVEDVRSLLNRVRIARAHAQGKREADALKQLQRKCKVALLLVEVVNRPAPD